MKKRKIAQQGQYAHEITKDSNSDNHYRNDLLAYPLRTTGFVATEFDTPRRKEASVTTFSLFNTVDTYPTVFDELDAILNDSLNDTAVHPPASQLEHQEIDDQSFNDLFNIPIDEETRTFLQERFGDINEHETSSSNVLKCESYRSNQHPKDRLQPQPAPIEIKYEAKNDLSQSCVFELQLNDIPIVQHNSIIKLNDKFPCSYKYDRKNNIIIVTPSAYLDDHEYDNRYEYLKHFGYEIINSIIKHHLESLKLYYNNSLIFEFVKDPEYKNSNNCTFKLIEKTKNHIHSNNRSNSLTKLDIKVINNEYISESGFFQDLKYHFNKKGLDVYIRNKEIMLNKLDILSNYELEELLTLIKGKATRERFSIQLTKKYKNGQITQELVPYQPDMSEKTTYGKYSHIQFISQGAPTLLTKEELINKAKQAINFKEHKRM